MELRHLRYFAVVAEELNITRAAARLHISQPPLSRQIRDLEDELGVKLLERGGKSLRLTPAGMIFHDEARAILARVEEARRTLRAFSGEKDTLRIGYAPSLSVEILPKALREFERLSPGTRVALHDFSTEEMFAGLRAGTLDAALMIQPDRPKIDGVEFRELARYAVCVAVAPSHPLATAQSPGLRLIFRERLIIYDRKEYPEYFRWLKKLCGGVVIPAEEHDSATSLIASVESGRGIALVPETFSCFAGSRLAVRKVARPPAPFVLGVVVRKPVRSPSVRLWLNAVGIPG